MIRVRKIAHASYEMPDLDKQAEYYTDILGLNLTAKEKDAVYLANTVDHHRWCCARASRRKCTRVGFQIGPNEDLNEFEKQTQSARREDVAQEGSRAVDLRHAGLRGSKGHARSRCSSAPDFAHQKFPTKGVVPHKLGHVAFHCEDVKKVAQFYVDVLGFRESDWMADFFVFLRCGPDHHTINLMGTGSNRHFHTAFEVRNWGQLQEACDFLSPQRLQDLVGPRPPRHRPQSLRLSSQPERVDHRIVRRARPDEGRGTRLFRAAALAPRQSAEARRSGRKIRPPRICGAPARRKR